MILKMLQKIFVFMLIPGLLVCEQITTPQQDPAEPIKPIKPIKSDDTVKPESAPKAIVEPDAEPEPKPQAEPEPEPTLKPEISAAELQFNLTFKDGRSIDGRSMFKLNTAEVCALLFADSKGQIINLLDKKKELDAAIRRSYNKILEQKRIRAMVSILAETQKQAIGNDYSNCLKRAAVNLSAQKLTESIALTKEDLSETTAKLLNEPRIGFYGLYVIVNKESQAKEIMQFMQLNVSGKRSGSEAFIEAASQYALVKNLDEGYAATTSEIAARFGNDILDVLNEAREGSCCQPVRLQKNGKWIVIWLKERSPIKLNESYIYSHALSLKVDSIVSKEIQRMKDAGAIQSLVSEFNESDLDPKNNKIVLQIGEYELTSYDLYKFIESILNNRNLKEIVLSHPAQNRKMVINYFFKTATDLMTVLYVKASLSKKLDLDKHINAEIEYKDAYRILNKYARSLITTEMVRGKFEEQKATMSKTSIIAEYIALESKKVADNLIKVLLKVQESMTDQKDLLDRFAQLREEYSIDNNALFNDRVLHMKDLFGQMETIERNKTKSEDPLHMNTVYLFWNYKTNLYYIVLITNINNDKDISYDEVKRDILNKLAVDQMKALYDESKCNTVIR